MPPRSAGERAAIDFDRCRTAINEEIVKHGHDPLPPNEISGLCAILHRKATGATPGHAPGEKAEKAAKVNH